MRSEQSKLSSHVSFTNRYHNFFTNKTTKNAPIFSHQENYLMRFEAPLETYAFERNNLTIIFFNKGTGKLNWRSRSMKLMDNQFIITNPSQGWVYENPSVQLIDVLSCVISRGLEKSFFHYQNSRECKMLDDPLGNSSSESRFLQVPLSANNFISGRLLKEYYRLSNQGDLELASPDELVFELLLSMTVEQNRGNRMKQNIQAEKKSTREEVFRRLIMARDYLHENVQHQTSIDELSQFVALSKFHMYDSFKRTFGKTPHQYLNRLRMNKAKEQLRSSDISIGQVAFSLGFSDQPSFSKLFKKHTGLTPSQFQFNSQQKK